MKKTQTCKIVCIGAGSYFTRDILADIMSNPTLREFSCRVVLVDLDEAALRDMITIANKIKQHYASSVVIASTRDRTEALPGADFVILAVERDRFRLWEQDFRVPLAFGFKHVLGENGGPGAMFHALRNYEIVLPVCHDIERLCPDALLLNFTNPESRILMAITQLSQVKAVGLCHGVPQARAYIAKLLQKDLETLDITIGGINHFFWVLTIKDKSTGQDLYPLLRQRASESAPPLAKKMVAVFDHFTYPSDDHIGEYLSFAHEFTGLLWEYGNENKHIPYRERIAGQWRQDFLSGKTPDEEIVRPSEEIAIDVIVDILTNRQAWRPSVNVVNEDLYVENLPRQAVVEVPAVVDAAGIHPKHVGPLPEPLAAFSRTQVSIQRLLVQAYQQRSRKLLLQALLLDPVINSVANAEKMLDYMLELQEDYLPKFD